MSTAPAASSVALPVAPGGGPGAGGPEEGGPGEGAAGTGARDADVVPPEGQGPRWLDPGEQHVWRSYLEGTQRLWEHLGDVLDSRGDLPLQEYEVLVRLQEAPRQCLRMSELAHALVHSRSRLTHTVGRMEARGLVERRASPDDGRGVLCVLAEQGRAALERNAPVHVASVRAALFDLLEPEELDTLGRALEKVAVHLRG